MPVNRFFLPVVIIITLLGTMFGSQALGLWAISGRDTVDLEQIKPEDVKGWMTLEQIIDGVPIAQDELYGLVNIPASVPPSTALKDMEPLVPGFEVSAVRDALTARQNSAGPSSQPAPMAQAQSATPTPLPIQTATPAATQAPSTNARSSGSGTGSHTGATPTPLPAGQILPADQIKGKMSPRCQHTVRRASRCPARGAQATCQHQSRLTDQGPRLWWYAFRGRSSPASGRSTSSQIAIHLLFT